MSRAERSRRTAELLAQAHELADPARRVELLDEVVLLNRGVAEAVANRYRGRGVAPEDLHQAAYEGLVKAVQKFDPSVRPDLLTYAVPTIRGEVQRWFRDQSWMVRPPRRLQEMQWKISRGIESLEQELGREPTNGELCERVDCTQAELDETVQSYGCFQPPSLDRPVGGLDGPTLGDALADDSDEQGAAEARATLGPAVRRLPARDREDPLHAVLPGPQPVRHRHRARRHPDAGLAAARADHARPAQPDRLTRDRPPAGVRRPGRRGGPRRAGTRS